MPERNGPKNLEELLDRMKEAEEKGEEKGEEEEDVSLADVLHALGAGSFGAVITLAGIIMLAPVIGDIPGAAIAMGAVVVGAGIQMLMGRHSLWLPDALLRRSVGREKVAKAIHAMRRPSKYIDHILKRRLIVFTGKTGRRAVAAVCVAIALTTPVLAFVPFSANGAGLALTAFGLALIAGDGLLALAAYAVTAGTFVAVIYILI